MLHLKSESKGLFVVEYGSNYTNFDDLYFQRVKSFIYLNKLKSYQPKWNAERSRYIRFRPHEKYNIENLKINGFLTM